MICDVTALCAGDFDCLLCKETCPGGEGYAMPRRYLDPELAPSLLAWYDQGMDGVVIRFGIWPDVDYVCWDCFKKHIEQVRSVVCSSSDESDGGGG